MRDRQEPTVRGFVLSFGLAVICWLVLATSEFVRVPEGLVLAALAGAVVASATAAAMVWRQARADGVGLGKALARCLRAFIRALWEIVF